MPPEHLSSVPIPSPSTPAWFLVLEPPSTKIFHPLWWGRGFGCRWRWQSGTRVLPAGGTSGRPHPRAALGFGVLRLELCPRRAFGASINNRCTLGLIKASCILHGVEGSCYFLPQEKCIFFLVPRALRIPRGSQVRWQQRRREGSGGIPPCRFWCEFGGDWGC